jgi:hypothetical protein
MFNKNETKRPCGKWKIYELEGWKKSRNVPSLSKVFLTIETIETDSNILDECAAENEWNGPSHQK